MSGGAVAVLDERERESGAAQSAEWIGMAGRRGDMPARFRRAGEFRTVMAQQEAEAAAGARSERQPPSAVKIGDGAVIGQLGDDA